MTGRDELRALAERVMALDGAGTHATLRSLEHDVSAALDIWWMPDSQVAEPWLRSLDAAMTLVPEGFMWRVQADPDGACEALCEKNVGDFGAIDARHTRSFAAAPAFALTAAALLAHAEQVPE